MTGILERKFLVEEDPAWRQKEGTVCRKGYLALAERRLVAVRVAGDQATLTVKGIQDDTPWITFAYAIPVEEASTMLEEMCENPLIVKRLYEVEHGGVTWQIEEFQGENSGLRLAKVAPDGDAQDFEKPAWIGQEVTGDPQYLDTYLVASPYSTWQSR